MTGKEKVKFRARWAVTLVPAVTPVEAMLGPLPQWLPHGWGRSPEEAAADFRKRLEKALAGLEQDAENVRGWFADGKDLL